MEALQELGVVYWKLDGEGDPKLKAIRAVRGYSYKVEQRRGQLRLLHSL